LDAVGKLDGNGNVRKLRDVVIDTVETKYSLSVICWVVQLPFGRAISY